MPTNNVIPFAKNAFERARAQALHWNKTNVVILSTNDPDAEEQNWFLVKPKDVPEALKDPDTLGNMLAGIIAQPPDSDLWYRAEYLTKYEAKLNASS